MWRQGDIYIERAQSIPATAIRQTHVILADGEATGHQHRIENPLSAILFEDRGWLYLQVSDEMASLVHEEHGPIELLRGIYRVWRQREYDPARDARSRLVID